MVRRDSISMNPKIFSTSLNRISIQNCLLTAFDAFNELKPIALIFPRLELIKKMDSFFARLHAIVICTIDTFVQWPIQAYQRTIDKNAQKKNNFFA